MQTQAMQSQETSTGLWFLNNHVLIRLAQADNADRLSILEMRMPAGEAPPRHVHHDEDEIFYVLDGALRFEVGEDRHEVEAGGLLMAPRGVPHGFRVVSPEGARVLIMTRGGFEPMVRAVSRPAPAVERPEAVAPSLEMQAHLGAECAKRAIDLIGPPIA